METRQCPHCGTVNDVGRALCANCQTPLTAYSGQLAGESYRGKLAEQVALLNTRPPIIAVMTIVLGAIAIGWPLRAVLSAFTSREALNAEGTNYLASAFGALRPVFVTLVCFPIAAVLFVLAWAVWTQREWAWKFALAALIAFGVYNLFCFREYHAWAFVWAGTAAIVAAFWFQSRVRAWFGLS